MSAYRFCRSDDVPLIVESFRRCNVGPGAVPWRLTVDHMKRLSREINLWTSSCMVALAGSDPIGVLIAAKREPTANLVLHVAVHPEHRRQGHARHMMTSLSQKMAILEPTRMLAEVPAGVSAVQSFLFACGFTEKETLTDYLLTGGNSATGPFLDLVGAVSASELTAGDDFLEATKRDRCWQRSAQTILNLRQRALGLGIATDRGFEAWLLYRDPEGTADPLPFLGPAVAAFSPGNGPPADPAPCEILAMGGKRPAPALLAPLLAFAARESGRALWLPRVHPGEPLADRLERLGFRAVGKTLRYEADAARS